MSKNSQRKHYLFQNNDKKVNDRRKTKRRFNSKRS